MTDVRNPRLELMPLTLREANGCVERHHPPEPAEPADNPVAARRRGRRAHYVTNAAYFGASTQR